MSEIKEGSRVKYQDRNGTVVALALYPYCYFNDDLNKKGNDGIYLVQLEDLILI